MPELPEVETIKNSLIPNVGTVIKHFEINKEDVVRLADYSPEKIKGKKIAEVDRRGKFLVFKLNNNLNMVFHLGMSGRFFIMDEDTLVSEPHVHVIVYLDNAKKLIYQDARRFGGIWFINDLKEFFAHMGKEPLTDDFNPDYLQEVVKNRRIAIKSLLLNQNLIAGIGNIYADEALFEAGIRPDRPAGSLSFREIELLVKAIKKVLKQSIEARGTTFRDYRDGFNRSGNFQNFLNVYGRTNKECPRCGEKLSREIIGGRSSHFCDKCQK